MEIAGWQSRQMLGRYAAATRAERGGAISMQAPRRRARDRRVAAAGAIFSTAALRPAVPSVPGAQ